MTILMSGRLFTAQLPAPGHRTDRLAETARGNPAAIVWLVHQRWIRPEPCPYADHGR